MKAINSFLLEKVLIAGLLLVFMATAAVADEQADKRISDTDKAVNYLFGLNTDKRPDDIILAKFKDEFKKKSDNFRKYKARLLEKRVEYNKLEDRVWMHLIFTRTKSEPDMWVVLTAYFSNDKIESVETVATLKEEPNRAF